MKIPWHPSRSQHKCHHLHFSEYNESALHSCGLWTIPSGHRTIINRRSIPTIRLSQIERPAHAPNLSAPLQNPARNNHAAIDTLRHGVPSPNPSPIMRCPALPVERICECEAATTPPPPKAGLAWLAPQLPVQRCCWSIQRTRCACAVVPLPGSGRRDGCLAWCAGSGGQRPCSQWRRCQKRPDYCHNIQ